MYSHMWSLNGTKERNTISISEIFDSLKMWKMNNWFLLVHHIFLSSLLFLFSCISVLEKKQYIKTWDNGKLYYKMQSFYRQCWGQAE